MTAKSLNFTKLSIWCDSVRLHDTLFSLEGICHTGPADISLSTQRLDGTQMLERLDLKRGEFHILCSTICKVQKVLEGKKARGN